MLSDEDLADQIIQDLNDLFVGKVLNADEVNILNEIVEGICLLADENDFLRVMNQQEAKTYSGNH